MTLTLDFFTVPSDDIAMIAGFYENAFGASIERRDDIIDVDLHGVGRLRVADGPRVDAAFPHFVVTYIVTQPSDVRSVVDAATRHGARMLMPPKKALFGAFSGVVRSPDGVVWKIAAASSKDTAPPAPAPRPTETTLIIGVADPKVSKTFYTTQGMRTDRDYGSKYIDFHPAAGASRFCLMQSPVLAKDVGLTAGSTGTAPLTLAHRTTREAGGGGATDTLVDPDGYRWVFVDDRP